ncbi:hypothetical protein IL38_04320 [Actinopolyspora erythraea]|uniref:DUF3592 domain-containing protein n=1 Tax=Actinopolyspora erythraea TaxID=414996 RepID=A0ABR4X835_9ACTN|nr:hypothetical protein IL38_04320 [Actinopolyspora erythraea]
MLYLAIGWVVLVVAGFGVLYGAATLNATTVHSDRGVTEDNADEYRWSGETIALSDNLRKNGWASCDVVPDSGERRDIRSPREDATVSYRQYQPWFSGTATVTCDEQVTIRSGATLTMYRLALSPLVRFGSAAIAAIPLVLALIWYYGLVRIRN